MKSPFALPYNHEVLSDRLGNSSRYLTIGNGLLEIARFRKSITEKEAQWICDVLNAAVKPKGKK